MSEIKVDLVGEERVFDFLARFPAEVQDAGLEAGYEYLLNALRIQPPPKYVTRVAAYDETFFTDKQRRWFFANLNGGAIRVPYRRTQGLRKAWKKQGRGQNAAIINDAPGAQYVIGDDQSRHEALVGWRRYDHVVEDRRDAWEKEVRFAVERMLKKLGA